MEIMGTVERPMMEYSFLTADGTISSIAKPIVQANNFEIKPTIIQIIRSSVKFSSLPDEDPNKHLANFIKICDTFKFNGVSDMMLDLEFFHSHYVITPKIGFNPYLLVQTFYNGVTLANRATIDTAAGSTIMKKLPSEAFNICLISIHTPTLTIRDGVVTLNFYRVTINSKDHQDIINYKASPTREEKQSQIYALQIYHRSKHPIPKSRCTTPKPRSINSKSGSANGAIGKHSLRKRKGSTPT
ncbi:hypothetical protein Sango_0370600 [Sesamum angolense]|uniref:Uncharacterized protein n=1 Tax=Sesamum angolense TaxID=2727404 RepID=A0AAE1XAB7_9LAMI|nr:hypothetical protein Sango_0370600 [Sesamum angolense]